MKETNERERERGKMEGGKERARREGGARQPCQKQDLFVLSP